MKEKFIFEPKKKKKSRPWIRNISRGNMVCKTRPWRLVQIEELVGKTKNWAHCPWGLLCLHLASNQMYVCEIKGMWYGYSSVLPLLLLVNKLLNFGGLQIGTFSHWGILLGQRDPEKWTQLIFLLRFSAVSVYVWIFLSSEGDLSALKRMSH